MKTALSLCISSSSCLFLPSPLPLPLLLPFLSLPPLSLSLSPCPSPCPSPSPYSSPSLPSLNPFLSHTCSHSLSSLLSHSQLPCYISPYSYISGAVAGLADQPLQLLWSEELPVVSRATGVVTGVGKGLLGAITKPISGTAEFVAQAGHGECTVLYGQSCTV